MGNKPSISCCLPFGCSTKVRTLYPVRGDFQRGRKKPSEHPKASNRPKCARGTSAGNGGSANISDPETQLNFTAMKEKLQRDISKELKIKAGAEKLRKVAVNEKHLQDVDEALRQCEAKLEELNKWLQNINACIAEREAVHLPGMCEDWNEENDVHPADEAMQEPQVFHPENVLHHEEEVTTEPEAVNVLQATLPPVEAIDQLEMPKVENVILPVAEVMETDYVDCIALLDPVVDSIQEEPPLSLEDFRCSSVLGRGAFGKVLLAEYKDTKKMFAIKAIKKSEIIQADSVDCLMNEKRIFQAASRGRHPFLVNLYASFQNIQYTFFVMEYAAGGDLDIQLQQSSGGFPVPRATFYTACVVLGLKYLHDEKIIHRDLKLANVVLDQQGFAKLTDFGISKEGMGFGDRTSSFCGTLDYMAPEMILGVPYTRAVDWWSLGVLLYVMLFGELPFPGEEDAEVEENINSYNIQYPRSTPIRITSILKALLQRNPVVRLGANKKGAEAVKTHFFFKDIDWSALLSRKVKPPFVPLPVIQGVGSESPLLTPQPQSLTEEEQDIFSDFDWIAEWED